MKTYLAQTLDRLDRATNELHLAARATLQMARALEAGPSWKELRKAVGPTNTCRASTEEIAAEWNVSTTHILNLARAETIPGVCIGNMWRFDPAKVAEALGSYTQWHRLRARTRNPKEAKE